MDVILNSSLDVCCQCDGVTELVNITETADGKLIDQEIFTRCRNCGNEFYTAEQSRRRSEFVKETGPLKVKEV